MKINRKDRDMTTIEMKKVFQEEIPTDELVADSGIFEFHFENGKSIGVSYEHNENNNLGYIFNIFLGDAYVNISGEFENIFDAVEVVTNEWNKW